MIKLDVLSQSSPLAREDRQTLVRLYADKRVLVTGGAGFIGLHLTQRLVELGAEVTVLDNFSTSTRSNLAAVQQKIALIEGTVTDFMTCLEAAYNQAYIFHLAAMVSVAQSAEQPLTCYAVNSTGTAHVLEAARIQSVPTVFFASSSAVYGDQKEPCHELMHCNPSSPYGFSKLMGELICKQYSHTYNVKTVIARYFNVHGPGQSAQGAYASVVASFRKQMALGQPIIIFGDGQQRRDFISVAEVVDATLLLTLLPHNHVSGRSVNIATGKSITILELFNQLRREFPVYAREPLYAQQRTGDIALSQADCSTYKHLMHLAKTVLPHP
jgi:nucleoside-diphosphate-sugar epimerase